MFLLYRPITFLPLSVQSPSIKSLKTTALEENNAVSSSLGCFVVVTVASSINAHCIFNPPLGRMLLACPDLRHKLTGWCCVHITFCTSSYQSGRLGINRKHHNLLKTPNHYNPGFDELTGAR